MGTPNLCLPNALYSALALAEAIRLAVTTDSHTWLSKERRPFPVQRSKPRARLTQEMTDSTFARKRRRRF